MGSENKNNELLGSAVIAGFLVLLAHAMVRSVVTAQEPFTLNDVLGAIIGCAMGLTLMVYYGYVIFLNSDEEWRQVAFLAVVGTVAVGLAYLAAYGTPLTNYEVYALTTIALISGVLITAANSGGGFDKAEAAGIYTIETVVVFLPLFVFLRTFKM